MSDIVICGTDGKSCTCGGSCWCRMTSPSTTLRASIEAARAARSEPVWTPAACEQEDHRPAEKCTCTPEHGCGEGTEAGCCWCLHSDVYEPCPVVGFICGSLRSSEQCDCCTPEQFRASGVAYGVTR